MEIIRIPKDKTPIIHFTDNGNEEIIYIEEKDDENIWFCMQQIAWEESQEENNMLCNK